MEQIIQYIKEKYHPLALIVYGSYADGSHNAHSDFDALVLAPCPPCHDVSFVGGVQLDLFVYPPQHFQDAPDCDEFVQIFDGQVLIDTDGLGAALREKARAYVESITSKPLEAVAGDVEWCRKMRLRAQRGDPEGMFRWHWLLTESLTIFCDMMGRPYVGPKKNPALDAGGPSRRLRVLHRGFSCFGGGRAGGLVRWLETKLEELRGQG